MRELSTPQQQELAALVDRAIEAVVRRRYGEAELAARRALAIDPRAARARVVVGMVMLQRANLGDPPDLFAANAGEAETVLAEQIAPNDAFVGWMRAVFLAEAGHMSAAATAAEAALLRTAEAPAAERAALLGIAGNYRYELGEERAALPHLQAYVGLRPEDASASFRIGACLLRIAAVPQGPKDLLVAQNQAEAAARAFARCATLTPGDEDVALAVGAALVRAAELAEQRKDSAVRDERRREAEATFREVGERFPGSAEAMFRLGVLEESRGAPAAAHQVYLQALGRDHQHLGSLLNLAALLETGGDAEAAGALLERALATDSQRAGLSTEERRRLQERLRAGPAKRG